MNRSTKTYYKKSVKSLYKEVQNLNRLNSELNEFTESKRNGVIRLETFHLIAAAQTLRNGIPILKKELTKNINWYRRRIR